METQEHKAVIDRIEEGRWAVLLVGKEQVEKIVPVEHLPEGAKAGTWLRLRLEEEVVKEIVVDAEETTAIRGRIESKMAGLRSRQRRFKPVAAPDENRSEPPSLRSSVKDETSKDETSKFIEDKPKLPEDKADSDAPDAPFENYFDWEGYE